MIKYAGYITKELLLPISFVITLLAGFFWLGNLSNQVNEIIKKDAPTRIEFNSMEKKLDNIEAGVQNINIYLRNNSK